MKMFNKIIYVTFFVSLPLFAQWELIWENTTYGLYGISAPDTMHIWAVGDSGKILHSNDGGDNWFWQESGITTALYDVVFIDSLQGWAVGDSGAIIITIDGGQFWQVQYVDTSVSLRKLYAFPNDSISWILGTEYPFEGRLFKSTNYGQNWFNYHDSSFSYIIEHDFHFKSGSMGWVVTNAPISFTKDAGSSWFTINYQCYFPGWINALNFTDTLTGYMGLENWDQGFDYYFIKTTDGGNTWELISERKIRRMHFNKNIGWAHDFGYDIILTTDDGNTWQDTWQQGVSYITDLTFASKNVSFTSGFYPIYIGKNRGEIHKYRITTSIDKTSNPAFPASLELYNYPNPFNNTTQIKFNLNQPQKITLHIYSINGRLVKTIIQNKQCPLGNNEFSWNGTDNNDRLISSGIYFIVLKSANNIQFSKKCLFLK